MKTRILAAAIAVLSLLGLQHAQAQAPADKWTFSIMPYLWLPSLDGTLRYGPPAAGGASPTVSVDASTLLGALDLGLMVNGEARKGRWLIGTDLIYLDLSHSDSAVQSVDFNPGSGPVNVSTAALDAGTQTSVKGVVWTLVGGYAAVQEPAARVDVIGGFRYFGLNARTDWQLAASVAGPGGTVTFPPTGSVEKSDKIWAGIVGAKGRAKLGKSPWFVNYYADVGGGSSVFTWQGAAGIGYAFHWGELVFDYRYLYYSMSGDRLVDNLSFGGFGLGANFRF